MEPIKTMQLEFKQFTCMSFSEADEIMQSLGVKYDNIYIGRDPKGKYDHIRGVYEPATIDVHYYYNMGAGSNVAYYTPIMDCFSVFIPGRNDGTPEDNRQVVWREGSEDNKIYFRKKDFTKEVQLITELVEKGGLCVIDKTDEEISLYNNSKVTLAYKNGEPAINAPTVTKKAAIEALASTISLNGVAHFDLRCLLMDNCEGAYQDYIAAFVKFAPAMHILAGKVASHFGASLPEFDSLHEDVGYGVKIDGKKPVWFVIQVVSAAVHDGTMGEGSFRVDIGIEDGINLADFIPYNYTENVWTKFTDFAGLQERLEVVEQMLPTFITEIENYLKQENRA